MADVVGSLGNENPGRPLRLVREGVEGSNRRGIDVNFMSGRFSIRFSGDYHVYSHVVFKGDERSQVDCRIVKLTVEYVYCSVNMHFSSVQGGIYALGKARIRSTLSLRRFPDVPFGTVPVLV